MRWPNEYRCALAVTVNVDGDLPLLAAHPDNVHRLKSRSTGLYGIEAGAARLLDVFARVGVPATWFLPGALARRHPELVRDIHEHGGSIAVQGHHLRHFDTLTREEQLNEMRLSRDTLQAITGETPTGFRVAAGSWRSGFPEAMRAEGFAWSSSLFADELPFLLTETGLVEVPSRYEFEDLQYLGYNLDPPFPPGLSRIQGLDVVAENWWYELEGAMRYATTLVLRLHAEVIGTPSRAQMLETFLRRALATGQVWMTDCATLAGLAREAGWDASHPYTLFRELAQQYAQHRAQPAEYPK